MTAGSSNRADPLAGLADDLESQREFLAERVPSYAAWYERPLLLLAALRADALRTGPTHPLWRAIGAAEPDADAVATDAVAAALDTPRSAVWHDLQSRHMQTNETSRAVAWLWPAQLLAGDDARRPLAVFDVGTSAGLNLVADRLAPMWHGGDGAPLAVTPMPPVVQRTGYDLRPLDAREEEDAQWLRACVWPGQHGRLERLDAAIAAFRAAPGSGEAPEVLAATAADIPGRLPVPPHADPRALVCQTIMRDYLPAAERGAADRQARWLHACASGSALWVELELIPSPRDDDGPPAALIAHVGTGGDHRSFRLARCEPHPVEIDVDPDAVAALRAQLAA